MLSGIPQVAQIGPSLVAKNGTPFCLFTLCERRLYQARCLYHRGGIGRERRVPVGQAQERCGLDQPGLCQENITQNNSPLAGFSSCEGAVFSFPCLGRRRGPSGVFFGRGGRLHSRGPDRVLQRAYGAGRGLSCCVSITYRQTHGRDTTRLCSASSCGWGPGCCASHATTACGCYPDCQV